MAIMAGKCTKYIKILHQLRCLLVRLIDGLYEAAWPHSTEGSEAQGHSSDFHPWSWLTFHRGEFQS